MRLLIELVVAVEVFINADSVGARWQIGINAEVLGVRGNGQEIRGGVPYRGHQEIRRVNRRRDRLIRRVRGVQPDVNGEMRLRFGLRARVKEVTKH